MIGSIQSHVRLGVANAAVPDVTGWAMAVLGLPPGSPVYQTALSRAARFGSGCIHGTDDWGCGGGTDNELGVPTVIRQVSAHDTYYVRRNVSDALVDGVRPKYNYLRHLVDYPGCTYYLNNEPEAGAQVGGVPLCDPSSVQRNRDVDPTIKVDLSRYWEAAPVPFEYEAGAGNSMCAAPEQLADAYHQLRSRVGQGVLLPPAAVDPFRLLHTRGYYERFYRRLFTKITPAEIGSLHFHHYSPEPWATNARTPLQSVQWSAGLMMLGVSWFKRTFCANKPVPLDVLLSEFGPLWWTKAGGRAIAGGWTGFYSGLLWWNSLLAWITRRAPVELDLQGALNGLPDNWSPAHAVTACIHEPDATPFVLTYGPESDVGRPQMVFDLTEMRVKAESVMGFKFPDLDVQPGYTNSFSSNRVVSWTDANRETRHYWAAPLGVCYATWAAVGGLGITQDLNTGWKSGSGDVRVKLPGGLATVLIPIIGSAGPYAIDVSVVDPAGKAHSTLANVQSFESIDQREVIDAGQTQIVNAYPAMVYPIVFRSQTEIEVTLSLTFKRGVAFVARPHVYPGACSWAI